LMSRQTTWTTSRGVCPQIEQLKRKELNAGAYSAGRALHMCLEKSVGELTQIFDRSGHRVGPVWIYASNSL
jgi:hypothetical protein